jgi:hypothetical protein
MEWFGIRQIESYDQKIRETLTQCLGERRHDLTLTRRYRTRPGGGWRTMTGQARIAAMAGQASTER